MTINFKFLLRRSAESSCETCVTRVCCFRKRQRSFSPHRGNLAPTMYHTLKSEYNIEHMECGDGEAICFNFKALYVLNVSL